MKIRRVSLWQAMAALGAMAMLGAACAQQVEASSAPAIQPMTTYVGVADLAQRGSAPAFTLVDVRPSDDFERAHVEGAINIEPLKLRAMEAWQHDRIVLIGTGAAYRSLEDLRQRMLADGFTSVAILDGGTAYWQKRASARAPATSVTADRIELVGDASRWVVLNVSAQALALPDSGDRLQPITQDARAARVWIQQMLERRRGADPNSTNVMNVLVVADDAKASLDIAARVSSTVDANVFSLNGTWDEVTRVVDQRRLQAESSGSHRLSAVGGQCW